MKKNALLILFLSLSLVSSYAGDKIKLGLRFSPNVSYSSVIDKKDNDLVSYGSNGSSVKFIFGGFIDFHISENVAFSTGLSYSPRSVKITSDSIGLTGGLINRTSQYNTQYLMVPLSFKFYTNELFDNFRIYFNAGGTFDIKIAEKKVGTDNVGLKKTADDAGYALFSYVDASLLLGLGADYQIGENTALFAGISYNRGLTNIINPFFEAGNNKYYQHLRVKNNLFNLDLGIRF